jgi:peptide/nickel transport system permease protein
VKRIAMVILIVVGLAVAGADWLAPYSESAQDRMHSLDPPSRTHLLGTDEYGRDQFSRLLYGGRLPLASGLTATALTLSLACCLGTVAGYYGGGIDAVLMWFGELFLALPWVYLLLAVRAMLPLSVSPGGAFLMLITVVGIAGWARPARLIRGLVLSAKERPYVYVARSFGASDLYLITHHILPETYGTLLAQTTVLMPQYILADITLSFLGLGTGEPTATWGGMLASLRHIRILESHWGILSPIVVLAPLFFSFHVLADGSD